MVDNKVAVVFPGQSSQQVGMLSDFSVQYPLIRQTFSEASEVLGYDIWRLVQYGPEHELNKTFRAQPAILTASVAIWRVWKQKGGCSPQLMAGHSLGEYSALVCAESINFLDAVKLVEIRGMLMQDIMPDKSGAMSVIIGLRDDVVCQLCKIAQKGQVVSIACLNAPKNVVISGHREAVDRANLLCKEAGAKYVRMLPITVPSHCILMKPMIMKFREILESVIIRTPNIPVINNVDVYIECDPQAIRDILLRQLYTTVRWYEIIQYLVNQKVKNLLEIGPGKILTGLTRSIVHNICSESINDPISLLKIIKTN